MSIQDIFGYVTGAEELEWYCPPHSNDGYGSSGNELCQEDTENPNTDSITDEELGAYTLKMRYYPVTFNTSYDKVLGEDQLQYIERRFNFKGYTNTIPSYFPNKYQIQGIMGEDTIQVNVGKNSFQYFSTYGWTENDKEVNTPEVYEGMIPRIGDVIYLEANDTFYEVFDVNYYNQAFNQRVHSFTLTLRYYTDNKYTISAEAPMFSGDTSDPIYKVAQSYVRNQEPFTDYLKMNDQIINATANSSYYFPASVHDGQNDGKSELNPFFDF